MADYSQTQKVWDFVQTYGVGIVASAVVLLILVSILAYSGLFHHFVIKKLLNPVGRLRVAYLYNTGPYKDCGPLFGRVVAIAPHRPCIGVYYDDPDTTPASELRYIVGIILSEDNKPVDPSLQERAVDDGFGVIDLPAVNEALGTDFPHRWMLSILCAVWRVYPALKKKIKKDQLTAGPCLEIYDGGKIQFVMPLSNHDAYFVPEALLQKSKST